MKKNDRIVVTIEDMGSEGEGIGKADGFPFFIKDALIGDVVEAGIMKLKKGYGYAKLLRVLEPSPDRVTPLCPLHQKCGGCQIQALSYEKQLEFKENKVKNNLIRLGGIPEERLTECMEPIIGMEEPYHYRNKAQFPVGTDREGRLVTGFYAGRTHQIIPNTDCCLGVPENKDILEVILGFLEEYQIPAYDETTGRGLVRHILLRKGFHTGELMVCLVLNGRKLPHGEKLIKRLSRISGMTSITLNVNERNTNVIMGEEILPLWGKTYITDTIGGIRYQISPLSFYQVNPVQTERLYATALEFAGLRGTETVWDLYCGIGTISLFLAKRAKQVYGVEIVPQAIADARVNAELNGIENVRFFVGKAEDVLAGVYGDGEGDVGEEGERNVWKEREGDVGKEEEGEKRGCERGDSQIERCGDRESEREESETERCGDRGGDGRDRRKDERNHMRYPDVIVVDPPRKGCDGVCLETMLKMQPERIVYVSCDSATLARDLKVLMEGGYELKRVRAVDMFGGTVHVETVVLLSHKLPDSYIL